MANRADRMVTLMQSGFKMGQALGNRLHENKKSDALSAAQEAQTEGIPEYEAPNAQEMGVPAISGIPEGSQQGAQLNDQWASDEEYTLMGRQKYGNDITAVRKRRQETLTEAAKYLSPSEMGAMEDRYNKKQKDDYRMGLSTAASMIERGADPQALADHLTNTYALNPTGSSGVASVVNGEVVMSFFDESTGEVKGTIPMDNADLLKKQAAAFDDPKWGAEFGITEKKMADAENRTGILMDTYKLNVKKENNEVAYKQAVVAEKALANDQTVSNTVATSWAKQDKAIKDRAEKVDKRVSTHMKDGQDETGVPWKTFGDRMGFHATATGIGVMNPGMMGAQPLVATQQVREIQNSIAEGIMNAKGGDEKYEDWQPGMPIPQDILAESYKAMIATKDNPQGAIQVEKDKNGDPTGQIYYNMNGEKVYLPPLVTGNGQPMSHLGLVYRATNGGGIYSEEEKVAMRDTVVGYTSGQAPGGQAPAPASSTMGVVGGGGGIPAPPARDPMADSVADPTTTTNPPAGIPQQPVGAVDHPPSNLAPQPPSGPVSMGGGPGRYGQSPLDKKADADLVDALNTTKAGTLRNRKVEAAKRVQDAISTGTPIYSRVILQAALDSRQLTTEQDTMVKQILGK